MKGKILLMLLLYIILGIIVVFNFGVYNGVVKKYRQESTAYETPHENWDKNRENPPMECASKHSYAFE